MRSEALEAPTEFRAALDSLAPGQHSTRASLLLGLGEALRRRGDTVGARQAFLDAARHARSVGDAELLGEAALGYGLGAGGLHRALRCDLQHIALLEEALSALGPVESALRVRLLARLAEELYFTPEAGARASLVAEAVAMARRIGAPAVLLPALHARELGHVGPDVPLPERVDQAQELAALARELGDGQAAYLGHMLRELALVESGRFAEAGPELDLAEQTALALDQPALQAWTFAARARQSWLAGRFAEAEAHNATAFALAGEQGGDPEVAQLVLGGQLLSMQLLRSDLRAFVPALEAYRHDYSHLATLRCFTAYIHAVTGELDVARAEFVELGLNGFTDLPRTAEFPGSMWAVTRTARLLQDRGAASQIYAQLSFCAGRWFADWASTGLGPVDTSLGILAGLSGAWEVAERHLQAAVGLARRAPSPPWLADALVQYADLLVQRGGAVATIRAQELVDEALPVCEALGLPALADQARALLAMV